MLPRYPVKQTGIVELNIRLWTAEENNSEPAWNVTQVCERYDLAQEHVETEGYHDIKVGIPNDRLVPVLRELSEVADYNPGIWEFCSFLCEDKLQERVLASFSVPEANYEVDANLGGLLDRVPVVEQGDKRCCYLVVLPVQKTEIEHSFLPEGAELADTLASLLEKSNQCGEDPYLFRTDLLQVYTYLPNLLADMLEKVVVIGGVPSDHPKEAS